MREPFRSRLQPWLLGSILAAAVAPPAAAQDAALGQAIYEAECVRCHADNGRGNGLDAPSNTPNFVTGPFDFDTDGDGLPGSADDFFDVIRRGPAAYDGTLAMGKWNVAQISDDEMEDLLAYLEESFTSRIPCDLCGRRLEVTGKDKLKLKKLGKSKQAVALSLTFDRGTFEIDGEPAGTWGPWFLDKRKHSLVLDSASEAQWLLDLDARADALDDRDVTLTSKKGTRGTLGLDKARRGVKLEIEAAVKALDGEKKRKGTYLLKASGDLAAPN